MGVSPISTALKPNHRLQPSSAPWERVASSHHQPNPTKHHSSNHRCTQINTDELSAATDHRTKLHPISVSICINLWLIESSRRRRSGRAIAG